MQDLSPTLGAVEIGVLLSIFLFGIATVQLFIYSQSKFKDSIYIRLLVLSISVLETAHTLFICILLYSLTVVNYGRPNTIVNAPWSLDMSAVLSSWIGAIIQAFFTYRIKVISGRIDIPIVIWVLSLLRASLGIVIGFATLRSKTLIRFIEDYRWLVTSQFVIGAVIDVINTSLLCFYLLRRRSSVLHTSHKLLDKLLIWTIETGLVTSITAVAMLICSLTMPHNLIYIGILMPYAKLYSNSLLTSLNARRYLRQLSSNGAPGGHPTNTVLNFSPGTSNAIELSRISVTIPKRSDSSENISPLENSALQT